jgi:dCTP diphosphatase
MSAGDEISAAAGTNPVEALREFVRDRDWAQFHSPENLAKSISIEAAELLECFQWSSDFDPERVQGELADVLTYCHLLADRLGLDANQIVLEKLAVTRSKYPVAKAYGRSDKYDEL